MGCHDERRCSEEPEAGEEPGELPRSVGREFALASGLDPDNPPWHVPPVGGSATVVSGVSEFNSAHAGDGVETPPAPLPSGLLAQEPLGSRVMVAGSAKSMEERPTLNSSSSAPRIPRQCHVDDEYRVSGIKTYGPKCRQM